MRLSFDALHLKYDEQVETEEYTYDSEEFIHDFVPDMFCTQLEEVGLL